MIFESNVHMSDVTFKAEAPDTVSQVSSPLMRLVATQVTVVQPLNLQVAKIGLHPAFMQPLILGAAHINVLAATDVHALVVYADLVGVFPVDGKQPPPLHSRGEEPRGGCRGDWEPGRGRFRD